MQPNNLARPHQDHILIADVILAEKVMDSN